MMGACMVGRVKHLPLDGFFKKSIMDKKKKYTKY
jgi:hypothetical protein